MSKPNILIGPDERQLNNIYAGARGERYDPGCLLDRHLVAIRQLPRVQAAPAEKRRALAAELGRRLTAAKPEELRNMRELLNQTVIRQETESCGFLGLGKRTVTKRYTEPRPSSRELVNLLRGEAYDAVYREHQTTPGDDPSRFEDQYENYYLITASGRLLWVCYTLNWDYNLGGVYDVEWWNCSEISDATPWICLLVRAAQVLGAETAEALCRQYV